MPVMVPGSLVAFASVSDGWYVSSLTQEIRFASVVMLVIVSGSLVALASVSDRWYALSFIQESDWPLWSCLSLCPVHLSPCLSV